MFLLVFALTVCGLAEQPSIAPPRSDTTVGKSANTAQYAKQGENQQQTANPVPTAPTQPDAEQLKRETENRQREIAIQEDIANLTRLLVYVGATIGAAQVFLMFWTGLVSQRTASTAAASADAATRQANHAEDSVRQAKAALDASIAVSRLEQRAWVGVPTVHCGKFEVGSAMVFRVELVNSGHTPAKKCPAWAHVSARLPDEPFVFDVDQSGHERHSLVVLMPNVRKQVKVGQRDGRTVSQTDFDVITSGRMILEVWGRIDYVDVFNAPHWTTFRSYYAHDLAAAIPIGPENDCD